MESAPAGHVFTHAPQFLQRLIVSGLWQYRQFWLQPCRNTAVRLPGPSTQLKGMILLTGAVIDVLVMDALVLDALVLDALVLDALVLDARITASPLSAESFSVIYPHAPFYPADGGSYPRRNH